MIRFTATLSLEKLTQNKKRGRPRKLGWHYAFDGWIAFELCFVMFQFFGVFLNVNYHITLVLRLLLVFTSQWCV